MDVFSLGDLGIQRGQAVIAGRDVNKLKSAGKGKWKYMSEADMMKNSEPFKPYRSTSFHHWDLNHVFTSDIHRPVHVVPVEGKRR